MGSDGWGARLREALLAACHPAQGPLRLSGRWLSLGSSRPGSSPMRCRSIVGHRTAAEAEPARRSTSTRSSSDCSSRKASRWCAWRGCSWTTGTPPRTSSRRHSSAWPVPRTGSETRPRPRRISDPSCSTSRATTTGAAWCRCVTICRSTTSRASTEDEIELREDQAELIEALRELPHRQRTALVLRYYEELGIDDIAEAMGISRNSVKTHLQRGLAALEQRLGERPSRSLCGSDVMTAVEHASARRSSTRPTVSTRATTSSRGSRSASTTTVGFAGNVVAASW